MTKAERKTIETIIDAIDCLRAVGASGQAYDLASALSYQIGAALAPARL